MKEEQPWPQEPRQKRARRKTPGASVAPRAQRPVQPSTPNSGAAVAAVSSNLNLLLLRHGLQQHTKDEEELQSGTCPISWPCSRAPLRRHECSCRRCKLQARLGFAILGKLIYKTLKGHERLVLDAEGVLDAVLLAFEALRSVWQLKTL